jgi:hypothetical protein
MSIYGFELIDQGKNQNLIINQEKGCCKMGGVAISQ